MFYTSIFIQISITSKSNIFVPLFLIIKDIGTNKNPSFSLGLHHSGNLEGYSYRPPGISFSQNSGRPLHNTLAGQSSELFSKYYGETEYLDVATSFCPKRHLVTFFKI